MIKLNEYRKGFLISLWGWDCMGIFKGLTQTVFTRSEKTSANNLYCYVLIKMCSTLKYLSAVGSCPASGLVALVLLYSTGTVVLVLIVYSPRPLLKYWAPPKAPLLLLGEDACFFSFLVFSLTPFYGCIDYFIDTV